MFASIMAETNIVIPTSYRAVKSKAGEGINVDYYPNNFENITEGGLRGRDDAHSKGVKLSNTFKTDVAFTVGNPGNLGNYEYDTVQSHAVHETLRVTDFSAN